MVQDGFSWRVLFFGWLGLLTYGAWISALLTGAVTVLLYQFAPSFALFPALLGLHVALAVFTAEIRLWELRLNGWFPASPVAAPSLDLALLRWIDGQAALLSAPEEKCALS